MKSVILIPARMASSRLPNKPLVDICGTSLVMRVYLQAIKCHLADDVIVVTDHQDILDHVLSNGGKAMMSRDDHTSGTDRIAEVATEIDADFIINVQGDEPLIDPNQIDDLITLLQNTKCELATHCKRITNPDMLFDFNTVKVVRDIHDFALYFSRQAIPAVRDRPYGDWFHQVNYYRHIGIYGFKKEALLSVVSLKPSTYEKVESLEQLRWIQNGIKIHCAETSYGSISVDTQDDVDIVVEHILKETFH